MCVGAVRVRLVASELVVSARGVGSAAVPRPLAALARAPACSSAAGPSSVAPTLRRSWWGSPHVPLDRRINRECAVPPRISIFQVSTGSQGAFVATLRTRR